MSDEGHPTRPIEDGEIERLHNALALATAGALDEALRHLDGPEAGEGGELEEMLRVFFAELRDTNARMEQVIADLEASKRELEEKQQKERQRLKDEAEVSHRLSFGC